MATTTRELVLQTAERLITARGYDGFSIADLVARDVDAGTIPASFDVDLLRAIVFAPTRELGSLWLARRVKRAPTSFARSLGDAAWAELRAFDS
jgi:hypothetical protein